MPSKHSTPPSTPPSFSGRPIDPTLHPIETGGYRIATPAIQAFADLLERCLRYRITGALTYGPSGTGKTRAIEYLRLMLAETHPKIVLRCNPRRRKGAYFAVELARRA